MDDPVTAQRPSDGSVEVSPLPVAIVGMHRSGTSMVTKLLREAGLHLGDEDDLMPPAEENPEGFYEHLGFVRLNDEVLNAAGAGWDCPPPSGFDWGSPALASFRDRARALASPLQAAGHWGWKDPRTSLTLPFWRSAIGPVRVVVVVRNPLEVVTSLHRRNGFSIALSLTLWRIYAARILEATSPGQRLVTHYDAYFFSPEGEITRLIAFLGLKPEQEVAALAAAAAPGLRHHRKTILDLETHGFPSEVIELYRHLCREAEWWEGEAEPASDDAPELPAPSASPIAQGAGRVDLLRVENETLRRNNADHTTALAGRENRILELETALNLHQTARAELANAVRERNGILAERDAAIARRNEVIATLEQRLAEREAAVSRLEAHVQELGERLAERERALAIAELHERELRAMHDSLQETQHQRDAEIMGTLGAVLSRYAPGAPAAIYHRRLVGQVRALAERAIPQGARTLVATYGDPALLALGDRPTEAFPRSASADTADYTDVSDAEAIAQLAAARDDGVEYLLVPGPSQPWLAIHPELRRHLHEACSSVASERGVGTVYALSREKGQIPA